MLSNKRNTISSLGFLLMMIGCVLGKDANGINKRDPKQLMMIPGIAPPRPLFYNFGHGFQQRQSDNQIGWVLKKLLLHTHPMLSVSQDPMALARSIDSKVDQLSTNEKMDVLNEYQLMVNSRSNVNGQSALGLLEYFFRSGNSKARQFIFNILYGNFNLNSEVMTHPVKTTTTPIPTTTPTTTEPPTPETTTPTTTEPPTPETTTPTTTPKPECTKVFTLDPPVNSVPVKINVGSTGYPDPYPNDEDIDCTYYFTAASGNKVNFDFAGNTVSLDPLVASLKIYEGNDVSSTPIVEVFSGETGIYSSSGSIATVRFVSAAGAVAGQWQVNVFGTDM